MALGWFQSKKNRWAVDRLHRSIQEQALRPDFYFDLTRPCAISARAT
jgi:hypothetical protein